MVNKMVAVCIILILMSSCYRRQHIPIKIDYSSGVITVLDNNWVVDSISIYRFGKTYKTVTLVDKTMGKSTLSLNRKNIGYRIFKDSLKPEDCDDNFGISLILRKRGHNDKLTDKIAHNRVFIENISSSPNNIYRACTTSIDTIMSGF